MLTRVSLASPTDGDGMMAKFWIGSAWFFVGLPLASAQLDFQRPLVPDGAVSATIGDVDGDGSAELVTAFGAAGVYQIDPLGVPEKVQHLLGSHHFDIDLIDIDGDGFLDFVSADGQNDSVRVRRGLSNGLFAATTTDVLSLPNAIAMTADDLNGDGWNDLVVALPAKSIAVVLASGPGVFAAQPALYPTNDSPHDLALADIDLDGDPDVIVVSKTGDTLQVMVNTAGSLAANPPIPMGEQPHLVRVEDLDQDGIDDLLVVVRGGSPGTAVGKLAVLLGDGVGGYAPATIYPQPDGFAADAQIADVDLDGTLDLIGLRGHGVGYVLPGLGGGLFGPEITFATTPSPRRFVVADIDHDLNIDLLVVSLSGIEVIRGEPGFQFQTQTSLSVSSSGSVTSNPVALDLDLDGRHDLVVTMSQAPYLRSLLSHTTFAGSPGPSVALGSIVSALSSADFDADGVEDLVVATHDKTLIWLRSTGAGGLTIQSSTSLPFNMVISEFAPGDFNNDGMMDIAIADKTTGSHTPNGVSIYAGNGAGFASPVHIAIGSPTKTLLADDLDQDGDVDLFSTPDAPGSQVFFTSKNLGSLAFSNLAFLVGTLVHDIVATDFDLDGNRDLVLTNGDDKAIRMGRHIGNLVFASFDSIDLGQGFRQIRIADLDGDGSSDLVASGGYGVVGLSALKTGLYDTPRYFSQIGAAIHLLTIDANSDGRDDVITASVLDHRLFLDLRECAPSENMGGGCPGTGGITPWLSVKGCLEAGGTLTTTISDGVGGGTPFLLIGLPGTLATPCALGVTPLLPVIALPPLSAGGPGNGVLAFSAQVPASITPPIDLAMQAVVADLGAANHYSASNVVRLLHH